jgi:hypothetical protein
MALLALRVLPFFPAYRPLFGGGSALLVIGAIFPRTGNALGQYLFGTVAGGALLPRKLFGVAWWILGAWLCKNLFDILLRRTFFPDNDEPHARRLFADLASGLIYVLAIVGIIGTVFNQRVSTFLATSGVVAVVLGLALQNTWETSWLALRSISSAHLGPGIGSHCLNRSPGKSCRSIGERHGCGRGRMI